ncbi:nitrile hydratase subunit beta [Leptospira sp. severe_002]|uniref:nitrile hydratase subunit beta n=1 Tax=Leptospira sp. severe_002 TaxID=2838237 RepID=UPI001E2E860B|nr:nitrile hydratase subunit beta [Leptospira sp. severe_002]
MNGVHDMGGMDGFGKVEAEKNEPPFHEPWEGRVLAMNRAMGATGIWNIDMSRYSREVLKPATYLAASYYQKWFLGLRNMLLERGFIDADELEKGHALRPGKPLKRGPFEMKDVERVLNRAKFGRQTNTQPKFKIGDKVRCKNINPATHTRLPRYVRGHIGIVELNHGTHVYPDTVSIDGTENPQWLYTVVFTNQELWGPDADPTIKVSIDAFEPYLELA